MVEKKLSKSASSASSWGGLERAVWGGGEKFHCLEEKVVGE